MFVLSRHCARSRPTGAHRGPGGDLPASMHSSAHGSALGREAAGREKLAPYRSHAWAAAALAALAFLFAYATEVCLKDRAAPCSF